MIACRRGVTGLLVLLLLLAGRADGQPHYPQGYFRNPLDIPILLAGNFGECRPNHFHSGIDIKTAGKENLPVHAAADGYISRIKTEPGGFGHALYITHPNGFTTLYAHLNNFNLALQAFLRTEQYRRESWTLDLALRPEQFPVKKGALIAYSGNTGGSTAPHLHLEIRDTDTEHPLNPQLFGFAMKDNRPPVPAALMVYDAGYSPYTQAAKRYPLKKGVDDWESPGIIPVPEEGIYVGVIADDFMDGSTNTLNFYTAEWYIDSVLQGRIRLDDIGYDATRYLHAYIDYAAHQRDDKWVQLLTRLPGNMLTHIYESLNPQAGVIRLPDTAMRRLYIALEDAAGNSSVIVVRIKKAAQTNTSANCPRSGSDPMRSIVYEDVHLRLAIPSASLYDQVCDTVRWASATGGLSPRFSIGSPFTPIHSYFPLYVKPNVPIPFALRDKLALRYSDGKQESGQAAAFDADGWYKADVRALGDYWLVADTAAPKIILKTPKAALGKASRILFDISDALTSVKSARAELDGTWILLEQHGTSWFYDVDAHCPPGRHQLVVKATDQNGSEQIARYDFVRKL